MGAKRTNPNHSVAFWRVPSQANTEAQFYSASRVFTRQMILCSMICQIMLVKGFIGLKHQGRCQVNLHRGTAYPKISGSTHLNLAEFSYSLHTCYEQLVNNFNNLSNFYLNCVEHYCRQMLSVGFKTDCNFATSRSWEVHNQTHQMCA